MIRESSHVCKDVYPNQRPLFSTNTKRATVRVWAGRPTGGPICVKKTKLLAISRVCVCPSYISALSPIQASASSSDKAHGEVERSGKRSEEARAASHPAKTDNRAGVGVSLMCRCAMREWQMRAQATVVDVVPFMLSFWVRLAWVCGSFKPLSWCLVVRCGA